MRTRDFRLTAAQADALRPAGWRRLLGPFASPRFSFAGPLGTGLATLGLVGILVAGGGIPLGGATSADTTAGGANTTLEAPATVQGTDAEDRSMAVMVAPEPDGRARLRSQCRAPRPPCPSMRPGLPTGARLRQPPLRHLSPPPASQARHQRHRPPSRLRKAPRCDPAASGKMAHAAETFGSPAPALPVAAVLALLAGLALLILRLAARRLA